MIVIKIIFIIFLFLILIGCSSNNDIKQVVPDTTKTAKTITDRVDLNASIKDNIKFVDLSSTVKGEYIYVTGALKNNSDQTLTYVKVNFNQLNSQKEVIDSEWDYVVDSEGIKPNEQKYFDIMMKVRSGYNTPKIEVIDFQY